MAGIEFPLSPTTTLPILSECKYQIQEQCDRPLATTAFKLLVGNRSVAIVSVASIRYWAVFRGVFRGLLLQLLLVASGCQCQRLIE